MYKLGLKTIIRYSSMGKNLLRMKRSRHLFFNNNYTLISITNIISIYKAYNLVEVKIIEKNNYVIR